MRLDARRRAVIALLVALPVGFVYLGFAGHIVYGVAHKLRTGYVSCDTGLLQSLDQFNGCTDDIGQYSSALVVIELVILTVLLALVVWMLARWVTWPWRAMRSDVEQLGPNSLGLRLRATGPHDDGRRLADAIDAMIDRVADGYEAQRRFAANASHELRTPLATQRALIEVSLTRALSADQLELLTRQLLSTNERNERLIDGLLTLAETEQGLRVDAPLRLDQIAAATVETFRPFAAERGVALLTDLAPASVAGEQPLLERLCANLVQNGVKYNVPDGRVQMLVRGDGSLRVTNTGPLVPADLVPTLFEPFRRASGDRLEHGGGAGLGLTIARSIVAAHGGTIRAFANPDGGLTVDVRLRSA